MTDGVTELLRERGWTDAEIMGVELAVQEAVANAIRHGCGNDSSKQIQCIVTCSDTGDVTVVVRDPGAGFDTQCVADPLHPENVLKTGGRGIFLINQLMDEVGSATAAASCRCASDAASRMRHPASPLEP